MIKWIWWCLLWKCLLFSFGRPKVIRQVNMYNWYDHTGLLCCGHRVSLFHLCFRDIFWGILSFFSLTIELNHDEGKLQLSRYIWRKIAFIRKRVTSNSSPLFTTINTIWVMSIKRSGHKHSLVTLPTVYSWDSVEEKGHEADIVHSI